MPAPGVPTADHRDFDASELVEAKRGRRVTLCLPARDEEATVGAIVLAVRVALMERRPLVDEVVVIDDGSEDDTAAVARTAGARVVDGGGRGKGRAMWQGVLEAEGDVVAFCDADVVNFGPHFVVGLVGPLLVRDDVGLVKGFYRRPLAATGGEGGRVTELVAKPLLGLLFPHLASLVQPLAGECAARRAVLEQVPFSEGYGVDIGLVLDVAARFGPGAVVQVDLGERIHRNRPLDQLAPQAQAVLHAVLARAGLLEPVAACPPLVEVAAYRPKTA